MILAALDGSGRAAGDARHGCRAGQVRAWLNLEPKPAASCPQAGGTALAVIS